jgi:hypothetical protein
MKTIGSGRIISGNDNSLRPGYKVINKFGTNFDIDTPGLETVWSHGGAFPFLDIGIPMDFKSTLASDNIAGTGAQKIELTYYLTDNTEVVEIKDTNGITPVQINDDVKIVTRMRLIQSGANKTNDGEINVVDRATGLVVYQSMEPTEGQTLSAVQICPKGKRGVVKKHITTYAKTQSPAGSADMRLNVRVANGSITTKHTIVISTIKPFDVVEYRIGGIELEEGDIIYWQCVGVSADNTPIEGRFDMEVFDA